MIASLRAEALKTRKRWANWILFGILLLTLLFFGYILPYAVLKNPPPNFQSRVPANVLIRAYFPENVLAHVLNLTSTVGAAIMIILGGLSTASEYGWLTVQTILIQKPGRLAVLAGKLLDLLIITVVFAVVTLGIAALTSYLLITIDGTASPWPTSLMLLKGFLALWLILAVWTAFGMFLGVAFRSTAAAIGGGLTYLFVGEALLAQLLRDTAGIKEVLRFLPGVNASGLVSNFGYSFRNANVSAPLVDATRGTLTLLIYLAVFTTLALLLFRRRDVTGGG